MPDNKMPDLNYVCIGGINTKASAYLTGPNEFLDLKNVDFQTPGALTQRWGSTQYSGQTFPGALTNIYEFEQLNGFSQLIISHTGGIWAGATTGNYQGISLTVQNATLIIGFQQAVLVDHLSVNASQGFHNKWGKYRDANGNLIAGDTTIISSISHATNIQDYVTFNNNLFTASNSNFFKYNGTTTTNISSPGGMISPIDTSNPVTNGGAGSTINFLPIGYEYHVAVSYINNRGYQSPLWPVARLMLNYFDDDSPYVAWGGSSGGFGTAGSFVAFSFQLLTPLQYGVSSVNIWIYQTTGTTLYGYIDNGVTTAFGSTIWFSNYKLLSNIAANGSTVLGVTIGGTVGSWGSTLNGFQGDAPPGTSYLFWGMTTILGATNTFAFEQNNPQYMELFRNRLFLSGFSAAQSTVWFSDVGEAEGYQDEWNFEIRTNDGDRITGLKAYNGQLIAFKKNSFHQITGDNPDNFSVVEISDQYGCLSNKAIATYDNYLLFLDRKGIVEYNGANYQVISNKIQPIFDRMNITAAVDNATMVHDRQRNQVLIGIPVDGSTLNNFTVTYDYLANDGIGTWTTADGYNPSVFAACRGRLTNKFAFYGDYSGRINYFGNSFLSDNGTAFTCVVKTRWHHDISNSYQKVFRRLYLDTTSVASPTMPISVFLRQDYGSSIQATYTMFGTTFQSRLDFGLSARSINIEMHKAGASSLLQLNGYTIEYRLQRRF